MMEFDKSVELAVRCGVVRSHGGGSMMHDWLVAGTTILCRRMPLAIPTMEPCEVRAVLGFQLDFEAPSAKYTMATRLLLSNGWSVQQTAQFYDNFRTANPELFDVRLARLFTREQLRTTYGNLYGDVLADLLVEPRRNPLLYALFYGNILEPVPMVFRTVIVPVEFYYELPSKPPSIEKFHTVPIPALGVQDMQGHYLGYLTAQRLYKDVTGGSLASSLTLSANDHGLDDTPQTKKALRQAHRAQSLRS